MAIQSLLLTWETAPDRTSCMIMLFAVESCIAEYLSAALVARGSYLGMYYQCESLYYTFDPLAIPSSCAIYPSVVSWV